MRGILFFLFTLTSLFTSAQPYILPKLNINKNRDLKDIMPLSLPVVQASEDGMNKFCVDCKNYDSRDGTCKLFYSIDLINGREYKKAREMRRVNDKCGIDGRFYQKNPFSRFKNLSTDMYDIYPWIVTFLYSICAIYIINHK
jgi:hypothetical protein